MDVSEGDSDGASVGFGSGDVVGKLVCCVGEDVTSEMGIFIFGGDVMICSDLSSVTIDVGACVGTACVGPESGTLVVEAFV